MQESQAWSKAFQQICVQTTGLWKCKTQLAKAQWSQNDKNATNHPHDKT